MKMFWTIWMVIIIALTSTCVAGTSVSLILSGSGKTAAQLFPDMNGNSTFSNLPDGKYKLDIALNTKHFILESDADNDGIADLEITTQRDASSGASSFAKNKTLRILLNDKGKRKSLSMSEWMQASSKSSSVDAAQTVIAVEIKIEGSTIKTRILYSALLEELKP